MEFVDIHGHYAWGIDDGIRDGIDIPGYQTQNGAHTSSTHGIWSHTG